LNEEAHLNTSFKHFIFFIQVGMSSCSSCSLSTLTYVYVVAGIRSNREEGAGANAGAY
jgi:hypothetical protein